MTRISLDGEYFSPNVCFITNGDDDDDNAPGPDEVDDGTDQGDADESDGDGDEADAEGSAEDDPDADDGEEDPGDVDAEPAREAPRRKTANDVIREQKKTRQAAVRDAEIARREAAEAKAEAAQARREAEEARRTANERRQAETAEDEARRVELMTDSERAAHYRQKDRDEHQREMKGLQFQVWDSADRSEFRQLKREDPLVAKVADKVEVEFERLRVQGSPVQRSVLADLFVGRMIRSERGKAVTTTKARTEERTRRETVKPTRTRSDATPQRQRRGQEDTAAARRKRLEDVQL